MQVEFYHDVDFGEDGRIYHNVNNRPVYFTDGACSRNGFNGARAGCGVWSGDRVTASFRCPGRQTNIHAELQAIKKAMRMAIRKNEHRIYVISDCQYAIDACTNWIDTDPQCTWVKRNGDTIEHEQLIKSIYALNIDVKFRYVNRDSGDYGNEQADRLAKEGRFQ